MSGATCRKRSVLPGVILCGLLVGPTPLFAQTIEFEERVEAQRAIEEVRSRHRIQAAGIQAAKLPSERHLEDKVESYLAKSLALTNVWNRTISGSDLQAELERMARDTKDPDRLRELFAALDDDPRLLAECLARPLLVDRTIRELYSFDARIHAPLREKIDAGAGGGATIEFDVARKDGDWPAFDRLPIGEVSDLVETAHYFQKETVIEKSDGVLRVSRTRWTKQPFDSWWVTEGPERDVPVRAIPAQTGEGKAYSLPQAPEAACTDDMWLATSTGSGVPDPREEHTAVWTGSEMIVWGGRDPSPLATGASYDPATDSWTPLPTGGSAPTARFRHSTVWTGTEMIVWGGFGTVFENSGARYDPGLNSWTATTIDVTTPTPRARNSRS
jgi:hypothetical protein